MYETVLYILHSSNLAELRLSCSRKDNRPQNWTACSDAAKTAASSLQGSDLTGADLSHADFMRGVLDRATIVGSDFSGAILARSRITGSAVSLLVYR
jgi:uncharacterized protein YjbI with pentapeptide repeats